MEPTKPTTDKERMLAPESARIDLPMECQRLRTLSAWMQHGHAATALYRYPDFRSVLMAMKAGCQIREQRSEGRMSLECLTGSVRVRAARQGWDLHAGQLLVLERCVPHELEALSETDLLLTVAWPPHTD